MANNISILDSASAAQVVKTTDTASVHTPHHNVDTCTTVTTCSTVTGVTTVSTLTNLAQFGGQAITMGTGVRAAGTLRVTVATDDSVPVTNAALAVVGNGTSAAAMRVTLASDSTGTVTLAAETTKVIGALGAGTNAIGKLTSNTGVTIGAVEMAAAQTLATVTTVGTVTTCSTLTGSGIAHDAADSGNPHKIGAKATASVLGATPVAAADRSDLFCGLDGVLINRPHTSLEDIISERVTNTDGAATAMTGAFAATASQRIYLTSLIMCNSSASNCTVDIRDGAAGAVLLTVSVLAGGGVVFNPPVPLRFTANTALAYDASAATTTLTITCLGFKSKQ